MAEQVQEEVLRRQWGFEVAVKMYSEQISPYLLSSHPTVGCR